MLVSNSSEPAVDTAFVPLTTSLAVPATALIDDCLKPDR